MARKHILTALHAVIAFLLAGAASAQWLVPPARQGAGLPFAVSYESSRGRGLPPLRLAAERPSRVPNQIVVKFRGPRTMARLAARTGKQAFLAGSKLIQQIPQLDVSVFQVPSVDEAMAQLRKHPDVLWVAPRLYRYPLLADPNDPAYNQLDYLISSDPDVATWYKWDSHMINCVPGWSIWPNRYYSAGSPKGTDAVRLAVIDTGIDYTHPDFVNTGGTGTSVEQGGQLVSSEDVSIFSGEVTPGAADDYGHGTHVAGIAAAATNNALGTVGTGYNAEILSIKVVDAEGNGTDTDIAQAMVYAVDHGALVMNLSLGSYEYSQVEQDAVNYAWRKNVLVVAAAGNDGYDKLNYPGALSKVLAVAATSRISTATYSNYGPFVGIAAPGGDYDYELMWMLGVYSTMPTYYVTLNDPNYYGAAQNYDYLMGTSMASPHVAGLAALYAGYKGYTRSTPGANLLTWQAIQQAADGTGGWDPYFGYGLIDVYRTLSLDTYPNPRGDTVGCITGQVRYRGTPVQNANVTAKVVGGSATFSASTRNDGGYRIINLPAGTYNVTASCFGETQKLYNVVVLPGCDTPGQDFNVGAFAAQIVVDDVETAPGATADLRATMTRVPSGDPVEDARLWFEVDGTELGHEITDALGVAQFPFDVPSDLAVGAHTITVVYYGDGAYQSCSGTGTLTVASPFETTLSVPDRTGVIAHTVTLEGVLRKLSDSSPVVGKTIQFSIDGTAVGSGTTDATGLATCDWTVSEGSLSRTIHGAFSGDAFALASSADGTLSISKADTVLTVDSKTGTAGHSVDLTGNLSTNPPVVGRTVEISVNGTPVGSAVTNASGNYAFAYAIPSATAVGDYAVHAAFAGDDNYNPSAGDGTLTVTSDTTITVADRTGKPGQTVSLSATLTASNTGSPLAGRTLQFAVDGTGVGSAPTDGTGAASVSYGIPEGAGSRTIQVSFAGEAQYNASSGTGTLTVQKAETTLWTIDRSGRITDVVILRQYDLKRTTDNMLLSGKTIVYKVDGTTVGTAVTDAGGDSNYTWTITDGSATRTITVQFAGDASYEPASATSTLTCLPAWTTKMATFDRTARIGARTELKARLVRSDDVPIANQTINFYVGGTFVIARPTNTEGYASYPYYDVPDGTGAGVRLILCDYAGGPGYKPVAKTAMLTVLKAQPYIWVMNKSVPYGGTANLYAYFRRLPDYQKQENKTLTFKVDGTVVGTANTGTTAAGTAGVARHLYPTVEAVGPHTITVEFGGDAWVEAGSGVGTLTIY